MSRVLIPAHAAWYHELKVVSYYNEAFVEDAILQHCNDLFPDHHIFPFKQSVTGKTTAEVKRPDLAIIRKDFSEWAVIEVELAKGKSFDHVLDQVRVFVDGTYNAVETAQYIRAKMEEHCHFDPGLRAVSELVFSKPPTVIVIADEHRADWQRDLKAEGIELCIFQIFKNTEGDLIYRAIGNYPVVSKRDAHCRKVDIANTLQVIEPFDTLKPGATIVAIHNSCLTQWAVIEDRGVTYLRFLGGSNPLSPDGKYVIFEDNFGKLHFRRT